MKIILNELRKIFEWKMIGIMLLMGFILYFLFASFYIDYFPNGRPALDYYNISLEMLEDYGKTMGEEDFEHFKKRYHEEVEKANTYLKENERARKAGISTYQEFLDIDNDKESINELHRHIFFEEEIDGFWELQARENYINSYELKEDFMAASQGDWNKKQRQRIKEVIEKDMVTSVFPELVFKNYQNYIRYVALIVLFSVVFMLSPIYLRDKKNNIHALQYTSKTGRNLFKKKALAALIASFIIITAGLGVFFLLYKTNHTGMFLDSGISSIFNGYVFWYNLTFLQYIFLNVLGIYALGIILALVVCWISSLAPNYITLIGGQIPLIFFTFKVLIRYLIQSVADIHLPQYFVALSYLGLTLLAWFLFALRNKREQTGDIL